MLELQRVLGLFSEVSGYKVKDQKSIIMDFNIVEQLKENLFHIQYLRRGGQVKGLNTWGSIAAGICPHWLHQIWPPWLTASRIPLHIVENLL